jgi:hypothetical protein
MSISTKRKKEGAMLKRKKIGNLLHEIHENLQVIADDFKDLTEIVDLLESRKITRAKDKIANLDTFVRDICLSHFNEDMLRQVDFEGRGKQTGCKYSLDNLAKQVLIGIQKYVPKHLKLELQNLLKM